VDNFLYFNAFTTIMSYMVTRDNKIIKRDEKGLETIIDLNPVNEILIEFEKDPSSIDYLTKLDLLDTHQKDYLMSSLFSRLKEKINILKWIDENPDKHQNYVDFFKKVNEMPLPYVPSLEKAVDALKTLPKSYFTVTDVNYKKGITYPPYRSKFHK
jgi:hypothetical protein